MMNQKAASISLLVLPLSDNSEVMETRPKSWSFILERTERCPESTMRTRHYISSQSAKLAWGVKVGMAPPQQQNCTKAYGNSATEAWSSQCTDLAYGIAMLK